MQGGIACVRRSRLSLVWAVLGWWPSAVSVRSGFANGRYFRQVWRRFGHFFGPLTALALTADEAGHHHRPRRLRLAVAVAPPPMVVPQRLLCCPHRSREPDRVRAWEASVH